MNKNILLNAYTANNLGDDIFIKILLNKFPDTNFFVLSKDEKILSRFEDANNLKLFSAKDYLLSNEKDRFDGFLLMGGSMFQETKGWFKNWIALVLLILKTKYFKKPTMVMGINFGPYQSRIFLALHKWIFKKITTITVRDETSYEILNNTSANTYCFPDLVFSLQNSKSTSIKNLNVEYIGVSLMDFGDAFNYNSYYEFMGTFISRLVKSKKIRLFSFQDSDSISDFKKIKEIISKLDHEDLKNIEIINYDNNYEEFLEKYIGCSSFLCTRFHSMILSVIFEHDMYVINYNDKIKMTTSYLDLHFENTDIEKLDELELQNYIIEKFLNNDFPSKVINKQEIIARANKHFEIFLTTFNLKSKMLPKN